MQPPRLSVPPLQPRAVAVECHGVHIPIAIGRLTEFARVVLKALGVKRSMLSITFVTSRKIAVMNKQHLGHSGPTDVITFALGEAPDGSLIADVYICPDVARRQAHELGVGVREEIARLVVHGILHSCGWEHPEGDGRTSSPMWRRQEQLLKRFWIPPSRVR